MPRAEGRNEAFSFLFKFFARAPRLVVYDFACALQEYCLNREPAFFANTVFMVDRFHWFNHTACARSYNLSLYSIFDGLNTQIAEQGNSALQAIKASVGQMKQRNFMWHLRLYMHFFNERKARQLREALQAVHQ